MSVTKLNFTRLFRTLARQQTSSRRCHFDVLNVSWRMLWKRKNAFHSVASTVALAVVPKPNNGEHQSVAGQRNQQISFFNCWKTLKQMQIVRVWISTDWLLITFRWVKLQWAYHWWNLTDFLSQNFRSIALHACVDVHTVLMVVLILTCRRHATLNSSWLKRRKFYPQNQLRKSQSRRSNPKRSFKNKRKRWCATSKKQDNNTLNRIKIVLIVQWLLKTSKRIKWTRA